MKKCLIFLKIQRHFNDIFYFFCFQESQQCKNDFIFLKDWHKAILNCWERFLKEINSLNEYGMIFGLIKQKKLYTFICHILFLICLPLLTVRSQSPQKSLELQTKQLIFTVVVCDITFGERGTKFVLVCGASKSKKG